MGCFCGFQPPAILGGELTMVGSYQLQAEQDNQMRALCHIGLWECGLAGVTKAESECRRIDLYSVTIF